jgi:hypothetical protein
MPTMTEAERHLADIFRCSWRAAEALKVGDLAVLDEEMLLVRRAQAGLHCDCTFVVFESDSGDVAWKMLDPERRLLVVLHFAIRATW